MEAHVIKKKQDEMMDMILAGMNKSDIAKRLDVARSTIYAWEDKEEIKAELDRRRQHIKKSAQDSIIKDACTYVDNMKDLACNSTDIRVRFQANKYLIDQCLGSPGTAKENNNDNGTKEENDINKLEEDLNKVKKMRVVK